jgi:DNA-binding beta-propeller fold protein YncE
MSLTSLALGGIVVALAAWQTTRVIAVFNAALARVASASSLVPLAQPPTTAAGRGVLYRLTLSRAVPVILILALALAGLARLSSAYYSPDRGEPIVEPIVADIATGGGVAVGLAGDIFVADARQHVIRRLRPRPPAGAPWSAEDIASDGDPLLGAAIPFDGVADIVVAPNGDLFIADAARHVVRRMVPSTGETGSVAGLQGIVRAPTALALAPNGDLYVADSQNRRVIVVTPATGVVRTVVDDLNRPMGLAVAPDGDLYIADTGSHRVQRLDVETGDLTTLATLTAPMGLALAPRGDEVVVYVADASDNHVHRIGSDGTVTTLTSAAQLVMPTRLAHHPAGWLYVKDGSPDGVTALDLR